ncbi:dienelactone hydrolase family protein [Nocardia fluminea]|uniref:Carboxymethylenebutenolidase n=1 Tax=Nocardia fluminea TaxID=134984 RepID=A0A2N3WW20_9NOCA|nr:dienelactone hydrolase family protein [Nocardia fluminea]PKV98065.1 carboxymethylenebutenolidase [Nocardia fluminea]
MATADGEADSFLAHPDDNAPHPAVLVYSDAFGLRPAVRRDAERLAGHGFTVLVPNLLYRNGSAPVVDLPEFIGADRRGEIFGALRPLLTALTPELVVADAAAYLSWLADSPLTTGNPVGLAGYCMGVRHALHTAAAHPDRVAAVAGFHGSRLATEDPHSPHNVVDRITAEVYLAHADADPGLPPEQIEQLDAAFTAAGTTFRTEVYPGADHGFTQSDTDVHDAGADARHWTELTGLFTRVLR